jgi:thymidine kinase
MVILRRVIHNACVSCHFLRVLQSISFHGDGQRAFVFCSPALFRRSLRSLPAIWHHMPLLPREDFMASLHYKFAAMNSGKSTQLIQAHFNYCERGMEPYAMTPAIDDRYGVGVITARVGLELLVDVFTATSDLFVLVQQRLEQQSMDVFIVDEAQFLSRVQVYQLAKIVDELNIPVIAYGLKSDFRGELFEGSYHLLCLADKVEELKSICWCGNKAHMNARVAPDGSVLRDGNQVEIGGQEKYVSLCRKHYLQGLAYRPIE